MAIIRILIGKQKFVQFVRVDGCSKRSTSTARVTCLDLKVLDCCAITESQNVGALYSEMN